MYFPKLGNIPLSVNYEFKTVKYPKRIQQAWDIYCKETKNDLDVKDFWEELRPDIQKIYLNKAEVKYGNTNSSLMGYRKNKKT